MKKINYGDVNSNNLLEVLLKGKANLSDEPISPKDFSMETINAIFFSYKMSIKVINICCWFKFSLLKNGIFSIIINLHKLAIFI